MQPPYKINSNILNLVSEISTLLGRLNYISLDMPEPKLRRKNRINTIKATLAIEGNTFSTEQVTAILDKKRVVGNKREIIEVQNAIELYEKMDEFKIDSWRSFLKAHKVLMKNLIAHSGKYRNKNVGVLKGTIVKHVAPKPLMVPELMAKLFQWIKEEKTLNYLIKSSIAHYEIEFIHPFEDGNGRIGRFWQSLILAKNNTIFKYVPIESLIEKNQKSYYETLETCDKEGDSTLFIEFMLNIILESLKVFDSETLGISSTFKNRIIKAHEHFKKNSFSRKEYMELFKTISTATASRDLRNAVTSKKIIKIGQGNQSRYTFYKR